MVPPVPDPALIAHLTGLFLRLFDRHPAHACLLDLQGRILAVNAAWKRFAADNGGDDEYRFEGKSYVDATTAAVEAGDPHASAALTGLLDVLATGRRAFTMTYPCHAPDERRWFKLWVQSQTPVAPVVVVAHQLERVEPAAAA